MVLTTVPCVVLYFTNICPKQKLKHLKIKIGRLRPLSYTANQLTYAIERVKVVNLQQLIFKQLRWCFARFLLKGQKLLIEQFCFAVNVLTKGLLYTYIHTQICLQLYIVLDLKTKHRIIPSTRSSETTQANLVDRKRNRHDRSLCYDYLHRVFFLNM